jgi:hypothetical protein
VVGDVPYQATVVAVHLFLLLFIGVIAALMRPLMWWAFGLCVLSILASARWPEHSFDFAAVVVVVANALFAWLLRPAPRGVAEEG